MQKHRNELQYSPEAISDLDGVWTYIFEELQNPDGAKNTVDAIMDRIDKLADFPQSGQSLSAATGIESDYRYVVCGNHVAVYHLEEATIRIDRVFHQRQDYVRILFGLEAE